MIMSITWTWFFDLSNHVADRDYAFMIIPLHMQIGREKERNGGSIYHFSHLS